MPKYYSVLILMVFLCVTETLFSQSWTGSFVSVHNQLKEYYAFGEWKEINWDQKYDIYSQQIAAAQSQNDVNAYYLALRKYAYSFNDSHLSVWPTSDGAQSAARTVRNSHIKGSYGFTLIELDDGRIIANYVRLGSNAATEGLEFGCEIIEIDNKPVKGAIENVSSLWSNTPQSTKEGIKYIQERFIGRAPQSSTMNIKFKRLGSEDITSIDLVAEFDNELTLFQTNYYTRGFSSTVSHRLLDNNIGYIKVLDEGGSLADANAVIRQFRAAMNYLTAENVIGIILDFRYNEGGWDMVGAAICSHFYKQETLYEHGSFYNPSTGMFEVTYILNIVPSEPYYSGPVVVLTSMYTASTGEGPPLFIKDLPNGETLGFYGTRGSFGLTGGSVSLPENFALYYPPGRSVDINNVVQVDSNHELVGGVSPSIRVPLTEDNVRRQFIEKEDVELEYAMNHINSVTIVEEIVADAIIDNFYLEQNYPNPFNPSTKIIFTVAGPFPKVELKVYNITGKMVRTLVDENLQSGQHSVEWNSADDTGNPLASGVYWYRLSVGGKTLTNKMTLLK